MRKGIYGERAIVKQFFVAVEFSETYGQEYSKIP